MNWEAIAAVGEVLGALGVLASLVYLASQIRDNTRSLQAASLQSVLDGPRDRFFLPHGQNAEISDLFARGLNALDNLDESEKRRFVHLMLEQCFQMQNVMQLRDRSLLSDGDYDAWLMYTASLFRTPGGSAMWPFLERVLTPTIRSCLSDYLKQNPEHPSFLDVMPMFRCDGESSEAST
jgi:hypothetical protein